MDCDGKMIPYSETERLITAAIFDAIVYVKGREKRTWLWNLLLDEREYMYIETFDAVYEMLN